MIPKIIWQTYKEEYEDLATYMLDAISTWKIKNPEYEYNYMSDRQARDFIAKEYGDEWLKIFDSYPVGVMRGDLWRYLIIYKYGGVYVDLDTECLNPISNWMKDEYDMIICPENDIHFCQWAFAAAPENPIIKSVLDEVKNKYYNKNYNIDHFVHIHTGPAAWTNGILKALDVKEKLHLIDDHEKINTLPKSIKYKLFLYGGNDWRIFHFIDIKHLYGSQSWADGQYVQWIKDDLVQKNKIFT